MTEIDAQIQQLKSKEAELLKVKLELIENKIAELQQRARETRELPD
jgi:hypothetical protein